MIRGVAFDLGDTLVDYEGLPLSWEAHYPEALMKLGEALGAELGEAVMDAASGVLRSCNTRIVPRQEEITFQQILDRLCMSLTPRVPLSELEAARAFFAVFRQRLRVFPEVPAVLADLRHRGLKIGVFTDVPYGMPSELVLEDVAQAGLGDAFDQLLTSRDVGFRKPHPETLRRIAAGLGCQPGEMIYVGNEQKDIEAARAFGCASCLVDRARRAVQWGQTRTVDSVAGVDALLD